MQAVKRALLYHLKILEQRYKTWRNSREIHRAYGEPKEWAKRPPVVRGSGRRVGVAAGVAGVVCLAVVAAALLSRGSQTPGAAEREPREGPANHAGASTEVEETARGTDTVPLPSVAPAPAGTAEESGANEEVAEAVPEEAWKTPDSMTHVLLANKAHRRLYVLRRGEGWNVERVYAAAYGKNGGRKEVSGDRRTPEGIYFIVGHKQSTELAQNYGPAAFVLNYPNADDHRAGRTGRGIWIHGTAPDSSPVATRGCIELNNHDLAELERLIGIGIGTPVVIVDDSAMQDATVRPDYREVARRRESVMAAYRRRLTSFARFVYRWQEAWESRDIDQYHVFYDTVGFAGQGLEWDGWRERKLRTFHNYDTISVAVRDIVLTDFESDRAVVKFYQVYRSNVLTSRNVKALFLMRTDGSWKIQRETTLPAEEFVL